eukprot:TRINITY_DN1836_c0_g2_i1.p1 TRINITY_DN1836_c0_g2~~TRINITY_DN1836_c0_g2_i1.p1  ORF type:complete len:1075 (+),score=115.55 TRINITY_DN1836_c0_g2_i1:107-3226(+)
MELAFQCEAMQRSGGTSGLLPQSNVFQFLEQEMLAPEDFREGDCDGKGNADGGDEAKRTREAAFIISVVRHGLLHNSGLAAMTRHANQDSRREAVRVMTLLRGAYLACPPQRSELQREALKLSNMLLADCGWARLLGVIPLGASEVQVSDMKDYYASQWGRNMSPDEMGLRAEMRRGNDSKVGEELWPRWFAGDADVHRWSLLPYIPHEEVSNLERADAQYAMRMEWVRSGSEMIEKCGYMSAWGLDEFRRLMRRLYERVNPAFERAAIGREETLQKLCNALGGGDRYGYDRDGPEERQCVLLTGPSGSGKSTVMSHISDHGLCGMRVIASHVCWRDPRGAVSEREFVGRLERMLCREMEGFYETCLLRPHRRVAPRLEKGASERMKDLCQQLNRCAKKQGGSTFLILIDGIDEAMDGTSEENTIASLTRILVRSLYPSVKVLISAAAGSLVQEVLSHDVRVVQLGYVNHRTMTQVIKEHITHMNREVQEWVESQGGLEDGDFVQKIVQRAAGNFVVMESMLKEIEVCLGVGKKPNLDFCGISLEQYYENLLERLVTLADGQGIHGDVSTSPVTRVLEVLVTNVRLCTERLRCVLWSSWRRSPDEWDRELREEVWDSDTFALLLKIISPLIGKHTNGLQVSHEKFGRPLAVRHGSFLEWGRKTRKLKIKRGYRTLALLGMLGGGEDTHGAPILASTDAFKLSIKDFYYYAQGDWFAKGEKRAYGLAPKHVAQMSDRLSDVSDVADVGSCTGTDWLEFALWAVAVEMDDAADEEGRGPNHALFDAADSEYGARVMLQLAGCNAEGFCLMLQRGGDLKARKLRDKDNRTFLHYAAAGGCAKVIEAPTVHNAIKEIINCTAADGWTALHFAVRSGNAKIVHVLLKKGALVIGDQVGFTPLHIAGQLGSVEVLLALCNGLKTLDSRMKVIQSRLRPFGFTALHYAAMNAHDDVVKELLRQGACVVGDQNGITPLHIAARAGYVRVVRALLHNEAGRRVLGCTTTNGTERTALDLAAQNNHTEIMELLTAAGARAPPATPPERS